MPHTKMINTKQQKVFYIYKHVGREKKKIIVTLRSQGTIFKFFKRNPSRNFLQVCLIKVQINYYSM